MADLFIGIDPGVNGGIAALSSIAPDYVVAFKMPATERDLLDALKQLTAEHGGARAVLEYVRAMPKMGVASMFEFGRGYGAIRMALTAVNIPFEEATPLKWQNALSCRTRGDKNVSKRKAQELFPGKLKITHAIADALLLAEYCRRLESRA